MCEPITNYVSWQWQLVMYRVGKITRPVGYPTGNWATRPDPTRFFITRIYPIPDPLPAGTRRVAKSQKNHETNIPETPVEVGPLQLSDLTSLQSRQRWRQIFRQLTAVDWLCNFLTDKPNLHRGLLSYVLHIHYFIGKQRTFQISLGFPHFF